MAYSDYQQVFALSMASNLAMNQSGAPAALQKVLATRIQALLADNIIVTHMPGWAVSWAPCVWQAEASDKCDQAMVVFSNGKTDVVAIAATNSASWYDWLIEDANVATKQPVAWSGAPASTWISDGTLIGINHLLGMPFAPFKGPPLLDYLQAQAGPNRDRTLIVAGHSLAGALAPSLALYLFTQGGLDITAWQAVKLYPTAGYSPGNANFAQFLVAKFPATPIGGAPYEVWNRLIWNTLDIVPRAWDRTTLTGLVDLYGTQLEPLDRAEVAVLQFAANELSGPDYKQLQSSPLTYHVTQPVTTLDEYLTQISYQHVEAYFYLFGVPELLKFMPGAGNPPAPPPPKQSAKRARAAAITHAMATQLS